MVSVYSWLSHDHQFSCELPVFPWSCSRNRSMCQGSDWQSPLTRCTYTAQTEDVELVIGVGICGNLQQLFSGFVTTKKNRLVMEDWLEMLWIGAGQNSLLTAQRSIQVWDLRLEISGCICPARLKSMYNSCKAFIYIAQMSSFPKKWIIVVIPLDQWRWMMERI